MRIAVIYSVTLIVAYLAYSDAAAPQQMLKSQSLIPFPRVGRSRAEFLQSMANLNEGLGGSMINTKPNMAALWGAYQQRQRDGNGQPFKDNKKKVIRWNIKNNNVDLREFKRHLIPFPRVGKRQSLIPFPRVGRSHFFPMDADDEGAGQSAEESLAPALYNNEPLLSDDSNERGLLLDDRTFLIPQMRWTINSSQESEE